MRGPIACALFGVLFFFVGFGMLFLADAGDANQLLYWIVSGACFVLMLACIGGVVFWPGDPLPRMRLVDVVASRLRDDTIRSPDIVQADPDTVAVIAELLRDIGHKAQVEKPRLRIWGRPGCPVGHEHLVKLVEIPPDHWRSCEIDTLAFLNNRRGEAGSYADLHFRPVEVGRAWNWRVPGPRLKAPLRS